METKTEVKTVEVDYQCPKCETGKLRPTGKSYLTHPKKYPHKCTDCDHGETFKIIYPYIDYESI